MPTDQPSGSSQMLRVGLPSTFMARSHSAVHRSRKAMHRRDGLAVFSSQYRAQVRAVLFCAAP
jgi:hypothetical protein